MVTYWQKQDDEDVGQRDTESVQIEPDACAGVERADQRSARASSPFISIAHRPRKLHSRNPIRVCGLVA